MRIAGGSCLTLWTGNLANSNNQHVAAFRRASLYPHHARLLLFGINKQHRINRHAFVHQRGIVIMYLAR